MMRTMMVAAAFMAMASAAQAAPISLTSASKGTTYFNRIGADSIAHDAALRGCILTAQEGIFGPPTAFGTGIIPMMMADGQQNYIRRTNIENCMVVRGWRVVRAAEEDAAALARLPQAALAQRLSAMVGAETPPGEIVRVWDNDAAKPDTQKGGMPGYITGVSLSLRSLPPDAAFEAEFASVKHLPNMPWGDMFMKPTPIAKLDARPADSAVIIVILRGAQKSNDMRLVLGRLGPDRFTPASNPPGPNGIFAMLGKGVVRLPDGRLEETVTAIAPAGRWMLRAAGEVVSHCMGAPYFDVKPGEVVFAGTFDFDKPVFEPDLDLDLVKTRLAAAPKTAAEVQAASWTNGALFGCDGGGMYALELPNVPFAEGYPRAGTVSLATATLGR